MNNLIVNGTQKFMGIDIPVVTGGFGADKKCVCDKTIAEIHGMKTFHVRELINSNIKRFKENVDFIDFKKGIGEGDTSKKRVDDSHTLELLLSLGYTKSAITQAEHIYILSERGYAKLIKIMDTDLAWEVHDRLIDEYFTYRDYFENLSKELKAIIVVDQRVTAVEKRVDYLEKDIPLYGSEADELSKNVKKKGVSVLGGKRSNAYKDNKLRSEVYSDIYNQIKREFGLYDNNGKPTTYKALKRRYFNDALEIVDNYAPPKYLEEKIYDYNSQLNIEERSA